MRVIFAIAKSSVLAFCTVLSSKRMIVSSIRSSDVRVSTNTTKNDVPIQ